MEMSIREAKAQFSAAIASAERGEPVLVTRHGKAVAMITAFVPRDPGLDWQRAAAIRTELGIVAVGDFWMETFNDPAFSRAVLGLDD